MHPDFPKFTHRPIQAAVRAALLTAAVIAVACAAARDARAGQSGPNTANTANTAATAAAAHGPPPPEVGVITLQPRDVVVTAEINGRVTPYLMAEVRPQVNGIILERLFEEGSDVQAGDALYQIDPAVYQAQQDNARAVLEKAVTMADLARLEEERYQDLLSKGATTQQIYDQHAADHKRALADVRLAEVQLDLAGVYLDYARIGAPIAGRVGRSSVTVGALVTAGQPSPLATIRQLDPIYIDLAPSSRDFLRLRRHFADPDAEGPVRLPGGVRVRTEDGVLYPHAGELRFVDVSVDESTQSLTLRAQFPNPRLDLLPGMYVRVFLDIERIAGALLLPQTAVSRASDGQAMALVAASDGSVERRPVELYRTYGDQWIVAGGVVAGERVIVEGAQRVRFMPGAPAPRVAPVDAPHAIALPAGAPVAESPSLPQ